MKKTIALAVMILALAGSTQSQVPQVVWSRSYGSALDDEFVMSVAAPENGLFILSNSDFLAPRYWDPILYRIDSLGDTLWSRSIDMVNVWTRDLAAIPDGGCVILTTIMDSSGKDDILVVRFSNTGDTVWARQFGGPGDQRLEAICVDANSDLLGVGSVFRSLEDQGTLIIKVSAAGDSLWAVDRRFGYDIWGEAALAIASLPDGDILIAGSFGAGDEDALPYVARLDSYGQTRFSRYYSASNATPNALATFPDGSFVLAGRYTGDYFAQHFNSPWLLRGAANGDSLGSYIDTAGTEWYSSVAILPDQSILTYGTTGQATSRQARLTRFDTAGRMTMRIDHDHDGKPTDGHHMIIGDFINDSSVILTGGFCDSLDCNLYARKVTSLPLSLCGDIDGDGLGPDISDLAQLVDYLFFSLSAPRFAVLADLDASGGIDISDLTGLVGYIFNGGPLLLCP